MDSASKRLIAEHRGDTNFDGESQLDVDMSAELAVGGASETDIDASECVEGAYLAHALRDVYYTP